MDFWPISGTRLAICYDEVQGHHQMLLFCRKKLRSPCSSIAEGKRRGPKLELVKVLKLHVDHIIDEFVTSMKIRIARVLDLPLYPWEPMWSPNNYTIQFGDLHRSANLSYFTIGSQIAKSTMHFMEKRKNIWKVESLKRQKFLKVCCEKAGRGQLWSMSENVCMKLRNCKFLSKSFKSFDSVLLDDEMLELLLRRQVW